MEISIVVAKNRRSMVLNQFELLFPCKIKCDLPKISILAGTLPPQEGADGIKKRMGTKNYLSTVLKIKMHPGGAGRRPGEVQAAEVRDFVQNTTFDCFETNFPSSRHPHHPSIEATPPVHSLKTPLLW